MIHLVTEGDPRRKIVPTVNGFQVHSYAKAVNRNQDYSFSKQSHS